MAPSDSATTTEMDAPHADGRPRLAAQELALPTASSSREGSLSAGRPPWGAPWGFSRLARRTLGICLLLVTVFLWTLSNFLASFIFSDRTYNKPFFLVYINTSAFAISLIPIFLQYLSASGLRGLRKDALRLWRQGAPGRRQKVAQEDERAAMGERLLVDDDDGSLPGSAGCHDRLELGETAMLSLEFCMLWFLANYFASACLEYTSVASVTILTSTSSVWTLIFCSLFGVESFTVRKLVGVMASLVGIGLVSTVDLSGASDQNRGSFPHKTHRQIAIGDSMAFVSAVVYGIYVTVMKKRLGDESKVDMRLFFGLVGLFNLALLWPLFFILHWTGLEPFQLPPSGHIWFIIVANSLSSFVSDLSWAYAMLLTTPLVVTVGLSLTIPLSLVGEMVQYGQYSSFVYWLGAAVVFLSFVFISKESRAEEVNRDSGPPDDQDALGPLPAP